MLAKLRNRLHRPSPAMVVAMISLFVGLGGTSVAAVTLKKNSVLSKHIKNGQVTSADVRNSSLRAQDFKPGQIPAGPQGSPGPAGPKGDQGSPGVNGATSVVVRSSSGSSGSGPLRANCQQGERAIGASYDHEKHAFLFRPVPQTGTPTGWEVQTGVIGATTLYVVCAAP